MTTNGNGNHGDTKSREFIIMILLLYQFLNIYGNDVFVYILKSNVNRFSHRSESHGINRMYELTIDCAVKRAVKKRKVFVSPSLDKR